MKLGGDHEAVLRKDSGRNGEVSSRRSVETKETGEEVMKKMEVS